MSSPFIWYILFSLESTVSWDIFKISLRTLKQMSKRYIEKPKQTYGFTVVSNILVYLKLLSLFARIVFNV